MIRRVTRPELRTIIDAQAARLDADAANPFATSVFTLHLLDQVARDDWHLWIAGEAGSALTLLYAEPSAPTRLRALTNYYASLYSPFAGVSDTASPAAATALVQALGRSRPSPATVELAPLTTADADLCVDAFRQFGWVTRRFSCFGNWYLPCDGLSFDAYMQARPSQLVNTWTRKSRKFNGKGQERLQLVTAPADVTAAMQAYNTVYAKSWKQPEPYPTFVADWAALCAERGWLRLGVAWSGDVPVAAQLWFTLGRRAFIYKLAYDEAYAKLSAGTVLSAMMFRHALEVDRVAEIDYLTGDDGYKRSWVTERRERVGVIACNPRTWRGAVQGAYELAGTLRERFRRAAPATVVQPEAAAA